MLIDAAQRLNYPMDLLFEAHNREQIGARAASGSILVVPVGAIEQHGPHLPTMTDSLVVERLALAAAQALGGDPDVIVAPTMSYGSSDHHFPFGATLSLGTETLLRVLKDLGRSAAIAGFSRLVFLNGHGGNHELVQLAARDLVQRHSMHVMAASWWQIAADSIRSTTAAGHERIPGHAGAFETAVVSSIFPDLVAPVPPAHVNQPPPPPRSRIELNGAWLHSDGFTDSPGSLPAHVGQEIVDASVAAIAAELREFDLKSRDVSVRPTKAGN